VTAALVEQGIESRRMVLVESNPGFCHLLRGRYPEAAVVRRCLCPQAPPRPPVGHAGRGRGIRPAIVQQAAEIPAGPACRGLRAARSGAPSCSSPMRSYPPFPLRIRGRARKPPSASGSICPRRGCGSTARPRRDDGALK
jgi:hypothetical protein